ncbi:MAG: hypothetical protein ACREF4_06580 [Gammaproteobacteria bacterium]
MALHRRFIEDTWSNTARFVFDAAVYALLTGLTFRMLWPAV